MGTTLTAIFLSASLQFHLPQGLLSSLCYVESKHVATAIHHDDKGSDSIGLCQLKLKTARWMGYKGTAQGLLNPKTNAYYSAKYLSYNINRYHSVSRGVIAYNRGNSNGLTTSIYQRKVFTIWRHK